MTLSEYQKILSTNKCTNLLVTLNVHDSSGEYEIYNLDIF